MASGRAAQGVRSFILCVKSAQSNLAEGPDDKWLPCVRASERQAMRHVAP
jgi:hypothetical protein